MTAPFFTIAVRTYQVETAPVPLSAAPRDAFYPLPGESDDAYWERLYGQPAPPPEAFTHVVYDGFGRRVAVGGFDHG